MPPSLYRRYVERFRFLKRAVEEGNAEALRQLELEFGKLPSLDLRIASMAIHDVSQRLPMRAAQHFERLVTGSW
jgi:hypothetical protein